MEVNTKVGKSRKWSIPVFPTLRTGSSWKIPIRLYWDDVKQDDVDVESLSVAVRDDLGLHVFIAE